MSSKKLFHALVAMLVCIIIGSLLLTYYGSRILKKDGDKLMEQKIESAKLEKEEDSLIRAKRDIEKYKELNIVAQAIVPKEKDQARTVREINAIALQSGVQIESIQFPDSSLGQVNSKKKKSTLPKDSTQLIEVNGLKNVFSMPIDVDLGEKTPITYQQLLDFLRRLESNRRTSHVTNISIQPNKDNRDLIHLSLRINVYIKP